MKIDTSTPFGQRVARRLQEERIIWLTTVDGAGIPQPRPVWFLWDGASFLIYSQPNTHKLRHLMDSPQVALNFDGDGRGGDIIVFTGVARITEGGPPADQVGAYVAKYQESFRRIGMTAAAFAQSYPVAIQVTPAKLRGH